MTEYISKSLEETKKVAEEVLKLVSKKHMHIIALHGDLGAGKTALTKCIAEILGIQETVTSPTFVIMKKYTPPPKTADSPQGEISNQVLKSSLEGGAEALRGGGCLVHIDAYRLESGKELEVLNFKEVLENKENLIIIEWPEIVKDILPSEILTVQCDFIDEMTRKYSF